MFDALIAIPLLLLLSALFSATETALFSLPAVNVKTYQTHRDPRKQLVAKLLSRSQDLIVTILMLNISVNLAIQNIISNWCGENSSWLLKVGLPLILTLLFGEIVPKSLAMQHNKVLAPYLATLIQFPHRFLSPIRGVLTSIVTPVSSRMFFFLRQEQLISKEELKHVLKTSQSGGVLHPDEAQLVSGYLDLHALTVKDLMRPRTDILYYDMQRPLSELKHLFSREECSRVPVCNDGFDQLLGIVTAQRFFTHQNRIHTAEDLTSYLDQPLFVPKTLSAKSLLRQFCQQRQELALAVDEYGDVCGLIACEDLVEVVVGEINDRRDQHKDYVRSGENVVIANGRLELTQLEELFGSPLISNQNMSTVAGWLIEQLKCIPQAGTKLSTEDYFFHVLEAHPQRVVRVYIRKLRPKNKLRSKPRRKK